MAPEVTEIVVPVVASPLQPLYAPIYRDGRVLVGAMSSFLEIWRYDTVAKTRYMESKISIIPTDDEHQYFNPTTMDLYGKEERIPSRLKSTNQVRF